MKTIEVEIRGRLDDTEYANLKSFLDERGVHKESHEREMFLLRDYPGYSKDFIGRDVDIRLRNTNGACEIMLKLKAGSAREEVSLQLKDHDLETAKKIVKSLGCTTAVWMHRLKEVYEFNGIEWSLVIAPNNIRYYEAEIAVADSAEVPETHTKLEAEAKKIGLEILDEEGTRALIHRLDTEANKVVEL
ncbi:MAG TPA: CYTH domain-containing protein [Candidatus Paceibacterota bacterium]